MLEKVGTEDGFGYVGASGINIGIIMLVGRPLLLSILIFGLSAPSTEVIAAQENVPYCHAHAGLNFPDFMVMWDYDNPALTEKKFKALLNLASNSQDKTYLSELLSQIATTYVLRDEHQEAEYYLKQAQLYLADAEPRAEANYLREKARFLLATGQQDKAIDSFYASWQVARESKYDRIAIETALDLRDLLPAERHSWDLKAQLVAETTKDPKAQQWISNNQARFL